MIYVGSTELMEHWDVEAQFASRRAAHEQPELFDYLLRRHRAMKAERGAACDARRAKREARWAAIAAGEREPVSILHLLDFEKAAA